MGVGVGVCVGEGVGAGVGLVWGFEGMKDKNQDDDNGTRKKSRKNG